MTAITLALAAVGSLLAFRSKPAHALCIYCIGLFLYPQPLTVQIGSADFSLGRILILAVLAGAIFRFERHRTFRWSWMDTLLSASYVLGLFALLHTVGARAFERQGGVLFDTLLPYLATRLAITREEDLAALAKTLAVITVPLVVLGAVQMLTGRNPIGDLAVYYHMGLQGDRAEDPILRLGLHRPAVTFPHPLAFGLFCAIVVPMTLSLWQRTSWPRWMFLALAAVACVGVFESLSNAPLVSLACSALVLLVYADWRIPARVVAYGSMFVIGCVLYPGVSTTDVLAAISFRGWSAVYRAELLREAFGGGMSGHWLTGFGYVGVGPGNDNSHFPWKHRDLVNLYLYILVRTGLLGLVPYLAANVLVYVKLGQALLTAGEPRDRWLVLAVLAGVIGWNVAFLSLGLIPLVTQLLFMTIAVSANMPAIVGRGPRTAP